MQWKARLVDNPVRGVHVDSRQFCPHGVQSTLQLPASTAVPVRQGQGAVVVALLGANF